MNRVAAIWWPEWSVVAAGCAPSVPAAVLAANRVVAVSGVAHADGVELGQRRRAAQAACPALEVFAPDPAREAITFEPVLAAVDAFTPIVELTRPGACTFSTRGPARYFGGDDSLAARVHAAVLAALPDRVDVAGPPGVGIADGVFAASLAAQHSSRTAVPVVIAPNESDRFVAPFGVHVLGELHESLAELVTVLPHLGITTLGALAQLPAADVVARFGPAGRLAHRLASGGDDRPLDARRPPPDLVARAELDPPAEQVEQVAFRVKGLAEELHDRLASRGLACTRILIELETEHGETRSRRWRHEGALSAAAIAERARWQLDGWLQMPAGAVDAPTAGVALVRLIPDEVVPDKGRQLGFWGGQTQADERAWRALARVGEMVGRDAVTVAVWRGGRGPHDELALVPADTVDLEARVGRSVINETAPWPGRLPPPSPSDVFGEPEPAEVRDDARRPVQVTGRLVMSAPPATVRIGDGPELAVTAWGGPWGLDERWWDPSSRRRRARLQVVAADGRAHLLSAEQGLWWVEATYD